MSDQSSPVWLAGRMILAPSKLVETDTVRQQGTPYGASTIPVVVVRPNI